MEQATPIRGLPENVQHELRALKKCQPSATMERFSALLRLFVELPRNEQQILTDDLFAWAERHANAHPLKAACARVCQTVTFVYSDRFGPALELALRTQRAFEKEKEALGGALCMVGIGVSYRAFGNVDLALRSLWEAYHELQKTELFAHMRMVAAYQIAGIYLDLKQHEEAIRLFGSTHDLAVKEGNQRLRTYSLQGLGKVYLLKGELGRAEDHLQQAVAAAELSGNPNTISGALTALAEMHRDTGDLEAAERLHLQALTLREAHGYIAGAATNCTCLGRVYTQRGRTDEAITLLHKGLALAEPLDLKTKIFQIHLLLSEIHQAAGDTAKGLFHYQRFHDIQTEVEVEDGAEKVKNLQVVFAAEQTRKENAIIKRQKAEIEAKNIELQNTIDELTRTRVGKKARAWTLVIAIVLFTIEDFILHSALVAISTDNFFVSLVVKMVIIFSLKPINGAVEHYLLKRIIRKKMVTASTDADVPAVETVHAAA